MSQRKIKWDEPSGCASPRGWCYISGLSLTYDGQKPCGNYVTYLSQPKSRQVHAMAYLFRNTAAGYGTGRTEVKWCRTVTAAKRWIQRTAQTLAVVEAVAIAQKRV